MSYLIEFLKLKKKRKKKKET